MIGCTRPLRIGITSPVISSWAVERLSGGNFKEPWIASEGIEGDSEPKENIEGLLLISPDRARFFGHRLHLSLFLFSLQHPSDRFTLRWF